MGKLRGISRREFAKRDGCSEKLVRLGLAKGRLIAFDDGSIDPSLVGTPWRQGAEQGADTASAGPHAKLTYAEAQRDKEIYLAKLRQLEFEVKSGRLVSAEAAYSAAFRLFREDRDALMNLPARIGPLLAAELSCDAVKLIVFLERHVRSYLAERSDQPELRFKG